MNIYLGNLDFRTTEQDLSELFEEFGAVESVKIITDKYSGKSKGFGFVTMEDGNEAKRAIDSLNGQDLKGRPITVNEARPRKESY